MQEKLKSLYKKVSKLESLASDIKRDIDRIYNSKPSDNNDLKKICPNGCTYSRTMNQKYPRTCLVCGNIESKPNL
jgi:hypothetical protein